MDCRELRFSAITGLSTSTQGLDVVRYVEPQWGDVEVATLGVGEHMTGLPEAAVKGLPIVIVWELEKRG